MARPWSASCSKQLYRLKARAPISKRWKMKSRRCRAAGKTVSTMRSCQPKSPPMRARSQRFSQAPSTPLTARPSRRKKQCWMSPHSRNWMSSTRSCYVPIATQATNTEKSAPRFTRAMAPSRSRIACRCLSAWASSSRSKPAIRLPLRKSLYQAHQTSIGCIHSRCVAPIARISISVRLPERSRKPLSPSGVGRLRMMASTRWSSMPDSIGVRRRYAGPCAPIAIRPVSTLRGRHRSPP